jgi:uncharacterized protein
MVSVPPMDLTALAPLLEETARARCTDDPAHDWLHVRRVVANARTIAAAEGADRAVCETAALLHELFNHPKGHPESHRSGEVCAEHARALLREHGAAEHHVEAVGYAIAVHPFSLGVTPTTLEARVLQDADRLDAIGAIGLARCFATCASLRRPFYDPDDPFCDHRAPDDKLWGVDHVYKKLLKLRDGMHTATGRAMAARRNEVIERFMDDLRAEIG